MRGLICPYKDSVFFSRGNGSHQECLCAGVTWFNNAKVYHFIVINLAAVLKMDVRGTKKQGIMETSEEALVLFLGRDEDGSA